MYINNIFIKKKKNVLHNYILFKYFNNKNKSGTYSVRYQPYTRNHRMTGIETAALVSVASDSFQS